MSTGPGNRGGGISSLPRNVWLSALGALTCFIVLSVVLIVIGNSIREPTPPGGKVAVDPVSVPKPPDSQVTNTAEGATTPAGDSESVATPAVDLGSVATSDRTPSEPSPVQPDAVAQARLIRLRTRATGVREQCNELQERFDEFSEKMNKLLVDESGQRLAANMKLVGQYQTLHDKERPPQRVITGYREELDALLAPLESIDPSPNVEPNWASSVDELAGKMRDATRKYEDDLRELQVLVASGKLESPSGQTLQEALNQREDDLARQRQKKQKEIEAAAIVEKERLAAEEAKRKREYEQLKREALSPEVLSLLAPLVTPDYTQPRQVTGMLASGVKTAKKTPVSLTRLRSLGALDPTENGMRKLALLNTRKWTSRPRWNMSYEAPEPNLWSSQQFEMIRKTQEYLNKYGDVLVKEGELAP